MRSDHVRPANALTNATVVGPQRRLVDIFYARSLCHTQSYQHLGMDWLVTRSTLSAVCGGACGPSSMALRVLRDETLLGASAPLRHAFSSSRASKPRPPQLRRSRPRVEPDLRLCRDGRFLGDRCWNSPSGGTASVEFGPCPEVGTSCVSVQNVLRFSSPLLGAVPILDGPVSRVWRRDGWTTKQTNPEPSLLRRPH